MDNRLSDDLYWVHRGPPAQHWCGGRLEVRDACVTILDPNNQRQRTRATKTTYRIYKQTCISSIDFHVRIYRMTNTQSSILLHHLRVLVLRAEPGAPVDQAVRRVLITPGRLTALVVHVHHPRLLVRRAKLRLLSGVR